MKVELVNGFFDLVKMCYFIDFFFCIFVLLVYKLDSSGFFLVLSQSLYFFYSKVIRE